MQAAGRDPAQPHHAHAAYSPPALAFLFLVAIGASSPCKCSGKRPCVARMGAARASCMGTRTGSYARCAPAFTPLAACSGVRHQNSSRSAALGHNLRPRQGAIKYCSAFHVRRHTHALAGCLSQQAVTHRSIPMKSIVVPLERAIGSGCGITRPIRAASPVTFDRHRSAADGKDAADISTNCGTQPRGGTIRSKSLWQFAAPRDCSARREPDSVGSCSRACASRSATYACMTPPRRAYTAEIDQACAQTCSPTAWASIRPSLQRQSSPRAALWDKSVICGRARLPCSPRVTPSCRFTMSTASWHTLASAWRGGRLQPAPAAAARRTAARAMYLARARGPADRWRARASHFQDGAEQCTNEHVSYETMSLIDK